MSSIPAPIQQVLQARQEATRQTIDVALVRKGLDAQQQAGEAINSLLEQAAELQRQLAAGHLDIKV